MPVGEGIVLLHLYALKANQALRGKLKVCMDQAKGAVFDDQRSRNVGPAEFRGSTEMVQ